MSSAKEMMRSLAHEAWLKEAAFIEARLRELIGTGMDLAVFRHEPVFSDNGMTFAMSTSLSCFPVPHGQWPVVPRGVTCTVYEVSKYTGTTLEATT